MLTLSGNGPRASKVSRCRIAGATANGTADVGVQGYDRRILVITAIVGDIEYGISERAGACSLPVVGCWATVLEGRKLFAEAVEVIEV